MSPNVPEIVLRVLLFAGLREAAGTRELTIRLPDGASVAELRARLAEECPPLRPLVGNAGVAINEEYADAATRLRAGDVVALIPPVSGGSACFGSPRSRWTRSR